MRSEGWRAGERREEVERVKERERDAEKGKMRGTDDKGKVR